MIYHWINIHPKIARELDEILAGNSSNSNDKDRNDIMYQSPNTMLYEVKNNRHKN